MESHKAKTTAPKKKTRLPSVLVSLFIFVIAVAIATSFSGVFDKSKSVKTPAPIASVRITKDGFQPATLSVKQGTKIIWTNADGTMHQVAANPYPKGTDLTSLKSEILNNDQTYTYTADTVGSFGYHDQLAPTINGTLIVKK